MKISLMPASKHASIKPSIIRLPCTRTNGLGVLKAVNNVNTVIKEEKEKCYDDAVYISIAISYFRYSQWHELFDFRTI